MITTRNSRGRLCTSTGIPSLQATSKLAGLWSKDATTAPSMQLFSTSLLHTTSTSYFKTSSFWTNYGPISRLHCTGHCITPIQITMDLSNTVGAILRDAACYTTSGRTVRMPYCLPVDYLWSTLLHG